MESIKKKAKELFKRFESVTKPFIKGSELKVHIHPEHAKQCALICVDEILNSVFVQNNTFNYWQEVKQEIEKL